jgi:hypothetical protein
MSSCGPVGREARGCPGHNLSLAWLEASAAARGKKLSSYVVWQVGLAVIAVTNILALVLLLTTKGSI